MYMRNEYNANDDAENLFACLVILVVSVWARNHVGLCHRSDFLRVRVPDLFSRDGDIASIFLSGAQISLSKMGWFWADTQQQVPLAPHPTSSSGPPPVLIPRDHLVLEYARLILLTARLPDARVAFTTGPSA